MMTPFWPWLVAGAVILLAIMIAIAGAAIVDAVERRRATAALARAAAARHHPAATGPTRRLGCCERPDYPPGAHFCIRCGRRR